MQTTRTLVLIRHAKAEAFASTDHARVLTARGTVDATRAGTWLADRQITPDRALVSSSARTVETWRALAAAAGSDLEPHLEPGLYDAGPESALDLVRATEDDVDTLLVIGHNPTIAYLAQMLDSGDGDPEASAGMQAGFPTSAVAVFELEGPWRELELGAARLDGFHAGRG